jgi:hypothetical protein
MRRARLVEQENFLILVNGNDSAVRNIEQNGENILPSNPSSLGFFTSAIITSITVKTACVHFFSQSSPNCPAHPTSPSDGTSV